MSRGFVNILDRLGFFTSCLLYTSLRDRISHIRLNCYDHVTDIHTTIVATSCAFATIKAKTYLPGLAKR